MPSEFNQKWNDLVHRIGTSNMPWGISGGNEWISYKQDDENDYSVQIFLHGSFEEYKQRKDAVTAFFINQNCILVEEHSVNDVAFGYWRELKFMDKAKHEQGPKEAYPPTSVTFNYAPGGVINSGNMSNTSISIDNSIHEIEKLIDEKGGDDKAELLAVLEDAKAILNESVSTKKLVQKPGFAERLTGHLAKHGWFYGAILQLLGTAYLTCI